MTCKGGKIEPTTPQSGNDNDKLYRLYWFWHQTTSTFFDSICLIPGINTGTGTVAVCHRVSVESLSWKLES